ncbi:MAG: c-type cytochrome [Verrucomicrobia bacterium]|nr:c-type cytochrome [Verrucomicrobiota bacterium]
MKRLLLIPVVMCGVAAGPAWGAGRIEKALVAITNAPLVQVLVPGFTVRELPLQLNNLNNLVYAPDGRLFALGYDGNVHQLHDTDGDGLEDRATRFFSNERNEIPPSIGMAWGPGGPYIASQKRVIRLRDRGDGTAELQTVTSDWVPPTGIAGSNLDSVGLAVNSAGEIFFGLGCDNWRDAYRVNPQTGQSEYSLRSERGTVLKISADGQRREIICTGVRFTVALAFNAAGDLFATDQEGATWLPNGNPFDELLHIQPGRHYGFPPRHPKHLPGVIDEPSTFDYGPQHQSTCGLHFNEPVAGGKKVFGPDWWRGDAIVAGQSRGKIWRTKLVKSAAGYVAQNNLIACLNLLTLDAVPTPQGDLLVACHSGRPDWGTGPQGKGRLFKISYTDHVTPQPVLAYAASSTETRVVFDRPLDAREMNDFATRSSITQGRYVAAGDRFETVRPGYQVVKHQRTMPQFTLPVLTASTAPNRRSLTLQTAPRTEAVNYAVTLPRPDRSVAGLRQEATTDLLTDLTGVEAEWQAARGSQDWSGWLPHCDLTVARGLTMASAEHEQLFKRLRSRGTLKLRGQIDLWQMLRAATQPDSKLDFEYPPETVTLVLKANASLTLKAGTIPVPINGNEGRVTLEPKENRWLPIEATLATGSRDLSLNVSWFTAEDARPRPLPLRRVMLPWARPHVPAAMITRVPEIEGGDWLRGKQVFFGEPAACSKCHVVVGEGGRIGPDLSNLIYRDYASVLRDILEPSAAINPDHISYNVELKDGNVESGVMLESNREHIVLGQANGENLTLPRAKVASQKASTVSVMPEGLLQGLDAQQQKDLMTFLLTLPPPQETHSRSTTTSSP